MTSLTLIAALALGAPALKDREPPAKGPAYLGIVYAQAQGGGLLVSEVLPDSPAGKAGLKVNDVLLNANDTSLKDMKRTAFAEMVAGMRAGTLVSLEIRRGTELLTVKVKLGPRPSDFEALKAKLPPPTIVDDDE